MSRWYPGKPGPHLNTHCPHAAMARFVQKCEFQPGTGCVVWTGGKTSGRGNHALYGSFWFASRRWFAHRWAAAFIHNMDLSGKQVDHYCPHIPVPNTLCVHHVQCITPSMNRELQWVRIQKGIDPYPYGEFIEPPEDDVPYYPEPPWLREWRT